MADLPRRPYLNSAVCGCVLASDGTTMTAYRCLFHRTAGAGVGIGAIVGDGHGSEQDSGYRYYRKLYEATGDLGNLDRMREYVTEPGGMDVAAETWEGLAALFADPAAAQRRRPGAPFPLYYLYTLLVMGMATLALNITLPVPGLWPHLVLTMISSLLAVSFVKLLCSRRRWKDRRRCVNWLSSTTGGPSQVTSTSASAPAGSTSPSGVSTRR